MKRTRRLVFVAATSAIVKLKEAVLGSFGDAGFIEKADVAVSRQFWPFVSLLADLGFPTKMPFNILLFSCVNQHDFYLGS